MGQEREIRQVVLSLGADACGFAAVDRFEDAPEGFHPRDIYPDCRGVVVFLKRMPKGLAQVSPRIAYHHFSNMTLVQVDDIALAASHAIERLGGRAVPVPCDSPYEYWDAERREGRGILSMRHAAVAGRSWRFGQKLAVFKPGIRLHGQYRRSADRYSARVRPADEKPLYKRLPYLPGRLPGARAGRRIGKPASLPRSHL